MGALKGKELAELPSLWLLVTQGSAADLRRTWVLAGILSLSLIATIRLCLGHQRRLLQVVKSPLRYYYRAVHVFPLFVAVTCWLQIFVPRFALLALTAQEIWEALALHYFGLIIVCLMGGPEETVRALEAARPTALCGAQNRWCVPPCCCLVPLLPCLLQGGSGTFTMPELSRITSCIEQYCYVAPAMAVFLALVELSPDDPRLRHAAHAAEAIQAASMLVCLQALFALYNATHGPLRGLRTKLKFIGIKSMIVLSLIQKLAILSLLHAGALSPPSSDVFTPRASATRLQAFVLGLELPFLQALNNRAFSADDLRLHSAEAAALRAAASP
eukprot:CAMPEP_0177612446 /NCGR_PEP_ID=MMETSP0419_2-20121207/21230_1 /TAXON_ID=582737 /ORGANISM="Tetraselmis sp., Strain GSL018" /LENGTH=329 /DNA_ID=CAMNT_0019108645 /DNA_START=347 /DNA_END=1336 /DNA_ORIENTATION=+